LKRIELLKNDLFFSSPELSFKALFDAEELFDYFEEF
jgi:hypothetical protein